MKPIEIHKEADTLYEKLIKMFNKKDIPPAVALVAATKIIAFVLRTSYEKEGAEKTVKEINKVLNDEIK